MQAVKADATALVDVVAHCLACRLAIVRMLDVERLHHATHDRILDTQVMRGSEPAGSGAWGAPAP